jgi:NitT/TauT family transport system ATP-binding protein
VDSDIRPVANPSQASGHDVATPEERGGAVAIDKVSLTFPGAEKRAAVQVLAGVSLSVDPGEFVCMIGPSGCGKSTLLSIIAGYLKTSSGTVTADGELVLGPKPNRVMVFQNPTLFPWCTAAENIAFGLKLKAARATPEPIADTVQQLLSLVGLDGFGSHYPHELSGGMRQRVEIARALAVRPKILLMDEPFGALDALTRLNLQREMERIWQETGKTVLFVTHDIVEAVLLADRVVVMSQRPAAIKEIVHINLPRSRQRDDPAVVANSSRIAKLLDVTF